MTNLSFRVPDMSCGHCVASVTSAVEVLEGVGGADIDLETKQVQVVGQGLDGVAIAEAIRNAGYEPEQS
jgi:copper chaperone